MGLNNWPTAHDKHAERMTILDITMPVLNLQFSNVVTNLTIQETGFISFLLQNEEKDACFDWIV